MECDVSILSIITVCVGLAPTSSRAIRCRELGAYTVSPYSVIIVRYILKSKSSSIMEETTVFEEEKRPNPTLGLIKTRTHSNTFREQIEQDGFS